MVLPPYFDKKSGQANTFLVAGGAVTQILLAPLIRYLLEVYSLKGAALIHSGIILNGLIAVSFFHPVKWHLRPSPREKQHPQQNMSQILMHSKATSPTTSSITPQLEVSYLMPHNQSVQKLRTSFSGSILSVMSAESDVLAGLAFLSDETGTSTADMENRRTNALWKTLLRVAERIKSDVTVLRQFRCVILAITETLTQTTLFNFIMMLPFVAKAADQSLEDAASCISLLGVTSLVTRLVVSPLSDCKWFSIRFSLMFGFFLKASGIIGIYPFTGLPALCPCFYTEIINTMKIPSVGTETNRYFALFQWLRWQAGCGSSWHPGWCSAWVWDPRAACSTSSSCITWEWRI